MTPKELLEGTRHVAKDFASPFNIIRRICKSSRIGFYPFLSTSVLSLLNRRWAKKFVYSEEYDYNH
jgi:hypothetical protein